MEAEGHIWLTNATTDQIIDELENRDMASILVALNPDDVSTLIEVQEEKMTEELASELNNISPRIQFTSHIEPHELRKVLVSLILGIPGERKPRRSRRLSN